MKNNKKNKKEKAWGIPCRDEITSHREESIPRFNFRKILSRKMEKLWPKIPSWFFRERERERERKRETKWERRI